MKKSLFLLSILFVFIFIGCTNQPQKEEAKAPAPEIKKSDSVVKVVEFIKNPQNKNKFDSFKDSAGVFTVTIKISSNPVLRINEYNTDGKFILIKQTVNKEKSWWNDGNMDGKVDYAIKGKTPTSDEKKEFSKKIDTTIGKVNESYWQNKYQNSLDEFYKKFQL